MDFFVRNTFIFPEDFFEGFMLIFFFFFTWGYLSNSEPCLQYTILSRLYYFSSKRESSMFHNCRRRKPISNAAPAWWTLKCKDLFLKKNVSLKFRNSNVFYWSLDPRPKNATLATLRKVILQVNRYFWDNTCKNAKDSRILFKALRKIKSRSC